MRFAKQVMVAAPQQAVWNFLWNVSRLAACVPGCDSMAELEPYRRYQATVRDKVGPLRSACRQPLRSLKPPPHTAPGTR
jgi:carbon monoxide dehydrogenase subunit G